VVSVPLTAIGVVSDRGVIGDRVSAIGDETLSDDEAMRLSGNTIRDESGIASVSKSRAWDRVGKRKV
jgi:hypothetical protein